MTCPSTIVDEFCAAKDPTEVLDYTISYQDVLEASDPPDSITSSTWSITTHVAGAVLTMDDNSFTTLEATIWLSGGGKLGTFHKVTNHITTAGGRQYERTILLWIHNK